MRKTSILDISLLAAAKGKNSKKDQLLLKLPECL
jgi:hypothetical protein